MGSIADRMAGLSKGSSGGGFGDRMAHEAPEHEQASEGGHHELHPHGDGTYHTVSPDGEKTEHPHIGHALVHMGMHHEPDGAHTHVHHGEDGTHTSHHGKDGEVSGPHDHENLDALKTHMDKFLGEEKQEDGWDGGGERG